MKGSRARSTRRPWSRSIQPQTSRMVITTATHSTTACAPTMAISGVEKGCIVPTVEGGAVVPNG